MEKQQHTSDPLMYTNLVNPFMLTEQNPIQALAGSLAHQVKVLVSLGKTRKIARLRIEQLQQQVASMESLIASGTVKNAGSRLDKLR